MTTYTGSCHCKAIQFTVEADIESVMECNCSHCAKKGFLLKFVPASTFTLTEGDDSLLTEYRFNKKQIAHLFCKTCGVQAFGRGKGHDGAPMMAINVRALDDFDYSTLPITKFNGKDV